MDKITNPKTFTLWGHEILFVYLDHKAQVLEFLFFDRYAFYFALGQTGDKRGIDG